jgi:hypothetical protein
VDSEKYITRDMKLVSEKRGLEQLENIRNRFRHEAAAFETKAKNCSVCETPGACCLDAHFVNVRITRLESRAVREALSKLPSETRDAVYARVDSAVKMYDLRGSGESYACPLYEKGTGCLVHETAKPLPCIAHACYENKRDLPPDDLLDQAEREVGDLNVRVYGKAAILKPLPVWLLDANRSESLGDRGSR